MNNTLSICSPIIFLFLGIFFFFNFYSIVETIFPLVNFSQANICFIIYFIIIFKLILKFYNIVMLKLYLYNIEKNKLI